MATGHYAQVVETTDGHGGVRRELHRAVDTAKDQSYVLGVLDAEQLARSFFPLGDTTKPLIREEAAERGFYIARKPDSHDICFIPDGDTRGWLTRELGAAPGEIVDTSGDVVGHHEGAFAYTVGQRRGLALSRPAPDGEPRYVVEVRPETNQVVVGAADLLGVNAITGQHARWCGPAPEGVVRVGAQVRAHGEEYAATAWARGTASRCDSTIGSEVWLPDSRSCSTTPPASSGRRPSWRPASSAPASPAPPGPARSAQGSAPRDGASLWPEAHRAVEPLGAGIAVVSARAHLRHRATHLRESMQGGQRHRTGQAPAAVGGHAADRLDEPTPWASSSQRSAEATISPFASTATQSRSRRYGQAPMSCR